MQSIALILFVLAGEPVLQESLPDPDHKWLQLGTPVVTESVEPLGTPNLRTDLRTFPSEIWADARSLVSWDTTGWLATGGTLAGVSASLWDDDVRRDTALHTRRWGGFNNVMDVVGHPLTHAGAASLLYGYSLYTDDVQKHRFSRTLLHSMILTNATTSVLKLSFDTTRPNGEGHGFPSGHAASSFAVAAVIEGEYGFYAGLGAYTVAGLVGWHRVDNRNHDLSDVLFGAALGIAIGKSVSNRHLQHLRGTHVYPYFEPEQGLNGLMFEKHY